MRPIAAMLALTLLLAGCGKETSVCSSPSKDAVAKALAGAPPALAGLHGQANQLLGGGKGAFQERMAKLRGRPVVVNSWGSWCGPCRGEFPVFQKAALEFGKKVAFVGLDAQDNDGNARKFLGCLPVTYPSYKDPDVKISNSIRSGSFFPTTIFFDKNGKLVYAHPGPYKNEKDLAADIRRYAQ